VGSGGRARPDRTNRWGLRGSNCPARCLVSNAAGTAARNGLPVRRGTVQRNRWVLAIRRAVMEALDAPARVFEAFAGTGVLYRAIWREATGYVGCDRRYFRDGRKVFVADNRRVMRVIDLGAFNLFDLDAYGSPWEQAVILAARRKVEPGERIGIVVTEGSGLNYKNNIVPRAVTDLTGLRDGVAVGLNQKRDQVHARILAELARRMNATVAGRWQAMARRARRWFIWEWS
jgi:hypothetical protein